MIWWFAEIGARPGGPEPQGLERIRTTWTVPSRSEPREARQCMGPATACQPKRTNVDANYKVPHLSKVESSASHVISDKPAATNLQDLARLEDKGLPAVPRPRAAKREQQCLRHPCLSRDRRVTIGDATRFRTSRVCSKFAPFAPRKARCAHERRFVHAAT